MKKGDLSINIIIIAAIALLILVIIAVLLFRQGGNLSDGTSCEGIGGTCGFTSCADATDTYGSTYAFDPTHECPISAGPDARCCIPLG